VARTRIRASDAELSMRSHFCGLIDEGLIGQSAADKRSMLLTDVPGDFIRIGSGLGHSKAANVIVMPALFEDDVKAVIELASPLIPVHK